MEGLAFRQYPEDMELSRMHPPYLSLFDQPRIIGIRSGDPSNVRELALAD
jgi:hypothetical protein